MTLPQQGARPEHETRERTMEQGQRRLVAAQEMARERGHVLGPGLWRGDGLGSYRACPTCRRLIMVSARGTIMVPAVCTARGRPLVWHVQQADGTTETQSYG